MMRSLLFAAALAGNGCSWVFQEHLPDTFKGHSEPQCSTSTGFATADVVFALLNGADLIYGATNLHGDGQNIYVAGALLGVLIHVASAGTGVKWAHECEDGRGKWEEYDRQRQEHAATLAEVKAVDAAVKPSAPEPRTVREGASSLLCSESVSDGGTGECFLVASECQVARERLGTDYSDCTERRSGACFNASVTLDDRRLTICAPSVKDCEAKRREKANDPDFAHVSERCGIYRQRAKADGPVEQSRDAESP